MREICANVIWILHIILMIVVVYSPFSKNERMLKLNMLLIPFLILHWITNNDTCALTELEKYIRNTKNTYDTFFGMLVGPVFKLNNIDNLGRYAIYASSITLWILSLYEYKNLLKKRKT